MEESYVLILVLSAVCGAIVYQRASGTNIVRFPYLFCSVWGAFVLPRMLKLISSTEPMANALRESGTVWTMSVFCMMSLPAGLLGYYWLRPKGAFEKVKWELSAVTEMACFSYAAGVMTLSLGALVLLVGLVGGPYNFFVGAKNYELEWSGLPVYYVFFAEYVYLAALLFLFLYSRHRKRIYLVFLFVCLSYPILDIIFLFRRSEVLMVGLVLAYGITVWRHVKIPRIAVLFAAVVGVLVVYAFPVLRGTTMVGSALSQHDLVSGIENNAQFAKNSEIAMAAWRFYRVEHTGRVQLGAGFYNAIVDQFVPAGIVGRETKSALLFRTNDNNSYLGYDLESNFYLAPMGFSQAYEQFGGFGFLVFFMLGGFTGLLERYRQKSFRGELLYVVMLSFLVLGVSNDIYLVLTKFLTFLPIIALAPNLQKSPQSRAFARPLPSNA